LHLNSCLMIGRVRPKGPQFRYAENGTLACSFVLEIDEVNQEKVYTTFIPCEINGNIRARWTPKPRRRSPSPWSAAGISRNRYLPPLAAPRRRLLSVMRLWRCLRERSCNLGQNRGRSLPREWLTERPGVGTAARGFETLKDAYLRTLTDALQELPLPQADPIAAVAGAGGEAA
jgi:hypothetical protein